MTFQCFLVGWLVISVNNHRGEDDGPCPKDDGPRPENNGPRGVDDGPRPQGVEQ